MEKGNERRPPKLNIESVYAFGFVNKRRSLIFENHFQRKKQENFTYKFATYKFATLTHQQAYKYIRMR